MNPWDFLSDTVTGDLILYAKWELKPYTVTYSGNAETTGSAPVDVHYYNEGDTVTVLGNTGNLGKVQDGISLLYTGWNTLANGYGDGYTETDTFQIGNTSITLYAQWSVLGGTGPAGGIVVYDAGTTQSWGRYIEASSEDCVFNSTNYNFVWYGGTYEITGASGTSVGTGASNTASIVTVQGDSYMYAAKICNEFDQNGYTDWHLPSKYELVLVFSQLFSGEGDTGGGYTYWSSSEDDATYAWEQDPDYGPELNSKNTSNRVRAVRYF